MKIQYREADLLSANEHVIIHGCNAQGAMNSGVAKAIRSRYPQAFADYAEHHRRQGLKMGEIVWSINEPHIVGNAITQEFYGRDPSVRYVSYDAIAKTVVACNELCETSGTNAVAFPFIGAGLANGNWSVIATIIEEYSRFEPVVYYLRDMLPEGLPQDVLDIIDP